MAVLLALLGFVVAGDNRNAQGPWNESPSSGQTFPLRPGLAPNDHVTANLEGASPAQIIAMYGELAGRTIRKTGWKENLNDLSGGRLAKWQLVSLPAAQPSLLSFHNDGRWRADELKQTLETILHSNRIVIVADGEKHFQAFEATRAQSGLVSGQKVAY